MERHGALLRSAVSRSATWPRSQLSKQTQQQFLALSTNADVLFLCLLLVSTLSFASIKERGCGLISHDKVLSLYGFLSSAVSIKPGCLLSTHRFIFAFILLQIACILLHCFLHSYYVNTVTSSHHCASNHKTMKPSLEPFHLAKFHIRCGNWVWPEGVYGSLFFPAPVLVHSVIFTLIAAHLGCVPKLT